MNPKDIEPEIRALEATGLRTHEASVSCAPAQGYAHPCTIQEFETVYRQEYQQELESCDRWINLCKGWNDGYGINFHQGMRAALVFNNIKMEQLLRVLKQEPPNARSGHNDQAHRPPRKDP